MSFNIYVAGAWSDKDNIRKYQQSLIANIPGAQITHDWTQHKEREQWTDQDPDTYAQLDLWEGVAKADAVVAIKTLKDYPYRGTEREIGFAQGRGIPVYVLTQNDPNSYVNKNIFHQLTRGQTTFYDWDNLLTTIQTHALNSYETEIEKLNPKRLRTRRKAIDLTPDQGELLREMLREEC